MNKKTLKIMIVILAILLIGSFVLLFLKWEDKQEPSIVDVESTIHCSIDSDCVVFGKTGECNCGCYNKQNLPQDSGGACFCQAPTSCKCVTGKCEGVFE